MTKTSEDLSEFANDTLTEPFFARRGNVDACDPKLRRSKGILENVESSSKIQKKKMPWTTQKIDTD
jgi:hypothetical protein